MRKQLFKQNIKRTLGLLLAVVMVLGLLPMTAMAVIEPSPSADEPGAPWGSPWRAALVARNVLRNIWGEYHTNGEMYGLLRENSVYDVDIPQVLFDLVAVEQPTWERWFMDHAVWDGQISRAQALPLSAAALSSNSSYVWNDVNRIRDLEHFFEYLGAIIERAIERSAISYPIIDILYLTGLEAGIVEVVISLEVMGRSWTEATVDLAGHFRRVIMDVLSPDIIITVEDSGAFTVAGFDDYTWEVVENNLVITFAEASTSTYTAIIPAQWSRESEVLGSNLVVTIIPADGFRYEDPRDPDDPCDPCECEPGVVEIEHITITVADANTGAFTVDFVDVVFSYNWTVVESNLVITFAGASEATYTANTPENWRYESAVVGSDLAITIIPADGFRYYDPRDPDDLCDPCDCEPITSNVEPGAPWGTPWRAALVARNILRDIWGEYNLGGLPGLLRENNVTGVEIPQVLLDLVATEQPTWERWFMDSAVWNSGASRHALPFGAAAAISSNSYEWNHVNRIRDLEHFFEYMGPIIERAVERSATYPSGLAYLSTLQAGIMDVVVFSEVVGLNWTEVTGNLGAVFARVLEDVLAPIESPPVLPASVTVAGASTRTVQRGGTLQFSATVLPASASQSVTWNVTGNAGATISPAGLLTVGANVPAGTVLRVTATATGTNVVSAAITVTVTAPADPDPGDPGDPDPGDPGDLIPGPDDPPRQWLPAESTNPFVDVPNGNWQNEPVSWAVRNGIATGIANTNPPEFRPNTSLNRETFATFLHRVMGTPEAAATSFADNASISSWARDAVEWGVEAGIILGFTDNTFRPQAVITREQIAAMLFRFAEYLEKDLEFETATFDAFPDRGQVRPWALEAMQWATYNGLITGVARGGVSRLEPQGNATRAQAVAVIYRFVMEFEVEPPEID